jgi:hypothetical protein
MIDPYLFGKDLIIIFISFTQNTNNIHANQKVPKYSAIPFHLNKCSMIAEFKLARARRLIE